MQEVKEKTKALQQSCKIFGIASDSEQTFQGYQAMKQLLADHLDQLIQEDFNRLIAILYRIDVSQEKAVRALTKKSGEESAGAALADLIIERQLKKITTRKNGL